MLQPIFFGSYGTYKCYNPFFLNFLIFHIIYDRAIRMYIGKIREISQTVRIGPVRIIENLRVEMPKKIQFFIHAPGLSS